VAGDFAEEAVIDTDRVVQAFLDPDEVTGECREVNLVDQ
jgi:hypothetical protein